MDTVGFSFIYYFSSQQFFILTFEFATFNWIQQASLIFCIRLNLKKIILAS